MHQPLPIFPPLFPPLEWWRIFCVDLTMRAATLDAAVTPRIEDFSGSISRANAEGGVTAREWVRFSVDADVTLSLPVEGGASALKNRRPDSWVFAREAPREARKIASTLATLYGRTPFFHLLGDDLTPCPEPGMKVAEVNGEMFGRIIRILGLGDVYLLQSLRTTDISTLRTADPSSALLPALFRLGPDAIFLLLKPF